MKGSDLSMAAFGVYLLTLGGLLAFIPETVLPVFGFEAPKDFWVRVLGSTFIFISWIYFLSVKEQFKPFYKLSIVIKVSIFLVFSAFYVLEIVPLVLAIFGFVDLLSALWTYVGLKSEKSKETDLCKVSAATS